MAAKVVLKDRGEYQMDYDEACGKEDRCDEQKE